MRSEHREKSAYNHQIRSQGYEWIEENWLAILAVGAAVLLAVSTTKQFLDDPYYISTDSALFQHAGWYITQGATPYVDFWDLKPPLIYAVTTLLALVADGDMHLLHVMSIALANAVVVTGVVLVGVLTHRLTGHGLASLLAGATMFVIPTVYLFPSAGLRPKYFAFLFGVAALLFAVDDRPTASGAAAAVSAGFWQLGGPLALLVVAMGLQRGGWRAAGRAVAGGLLVAVAVVAPFVAADLTVPLFVETVLAPIYSVERYTVPGRLLELMLELGYGVFLLPIGIYGWAKGALRDPSRYWWVGAGGVVYLLQVFLEMQGAIEMILLFLFLSLGVGLLVATVSTPSRESVVVGVVMLLAVLNFFWATSPLTPVKHDIEEVQEEMAVADYESVADAPDGVPSMKTIYWEKRQPDSCHYRAGYKQRDFVEKVGTTVEKEQCGQWPFDRPPREWLVDRLSSLLHVERSPAAAPYK